MSVTKGKQFVDFFVQLCEQLGYGVWSPPRETCKPWDVLVNGRSVQVKARSVCTVKPNCIRLKTNLGPAAIAYSRADFDVLALHWRDQWYLIPTAQICVDGGVRNGIFMPPMGAWANRWEVLSGAAVAYEHQKGFDF